MSDFRLFACVTVAVFYGLKLLGGAKPGISLADQIATCAFAGLLAVAVRTANSWFDHRREARKGRA